MPYPTLQFQATGDYRMQEANYGAIAGAIGGGLATVVAAIVTLLNAGAIRTWLEQRGQRIVFAQNKFTEELRIRDDRIAGMESQLMSLITETRALAIRLAEAETKSGIYGERVSEQASQILELEMRMAQCREENQSLKEIVNRRGGV